MGFFLYPSANTEVSRGNRTQFEPAAISRSASSDLFRAITHQLRVSVQESRAISSLPALEGVTAKVKELASVPDDWDSYNTAAPSHSAIDEALKLLPFWQSIDLLPNLVLASSEGGVALDAPGDDGRRALVETLNNGLTYILLYDNRSFCETLFLKNEEDKLRSSFAVMSKFLREGPGTGGDE